MSVLHALWRVGKLIIRRFYRCFERVQILVSRGARRDGSLNCERREYKIFKIPFARSGSDVTDD